MLGTGPVATRRWALENPKGWYEDGEAVTYFELRRTLRWALRDETYVGAR